ncbi:MAG: hypothetical protein EHM71_02680 [Zetaproteobacteria bacterium]|nr:MAG: hypothetical protein EHM71_02680 [Zetaproteobacteria bacterium]
MTRQPRLPVVVLLVLMAAPAQLAVHALGQTAIARVMGDGDATLRAHAGRTGGPTWTRAAGYDPEKLSAAGQALVPLGGLVCTQVARAVVAGAGGFPRPSGIDLADLLAVVHGWTGASVMGLTVALVVVSSAYCALAGRVLVRRLRGRSWAP